MASVGLEDELVLPCGARLINRLCKAAMTEGLADAHGVATVQHERLYSKWSKSGCGLLLTGNVQIDARYIERPGNVCAGEKLSPEAMAALKRFAATATQEKGVHCWAQISHGGRQSSLMIAKKSPAPSAVPSKGLVPLPTPFALKTEEVEELVQRYALAAKQCKEAGFTGVQLHSAHGYLLSSFLNPLANKRTDKYGGNIENRARFLLEVIRAVRKEVGPSFPVSVKLNSSDFQKGGFTHAEAAQVAEWLDEQGLDLLEISGGNYETATIMTGEEGQIDKLATMKHMGKKSTAIREAYFLKYAKDIAQRLKKTPLMVTGGFRSRSVMEDALKGGNVSIIGIGRPLCVVTDCVAQMLAGKIDKLPSPENEWELPWYVRWLQYVVVGNLLKIGGGMMAFYWNLFQIGKGLEAEKEPNLLLSLVRVNQIETAMAKKILKALPEDPTLQPRKSSNKLIPFLAVLAVAYFLRRALA